MSFAARCLAAPAQVSYTVTNGFPANTAGYSKGSFGAAIGPMVWGFLEVTSFYTVDTGLGAAGLVIGFTKLNGLLPTSADIQFARLIITSAAAPWPAAYAKGAFAESVSGNERVLTAGFSDPPYSNFTIGGELFTLSTF